MSLLFDLYYKAADWTIDRPFALCSSPNCVIGYYKSIDEAVQKANQMGANIREMWLKDPTIYRNPTKNPIEYIYK